MESGNHCVQPRGRSRPSLRSDVEGPHTPERNLFGDACKEGTVVGFEILRTSGRSGTFHSLYWGLPRIDPTLSCWSSQGPWTGGEGRGWGLSSEPQGEKRGEKRPEKRTGKNPRGDGVVRLSGLSREYFPDLRWNFNFTFTKVGREGRSLSRFFSLVSTHTSKYNIVVTNITTFCNLC